LQLEIKNDEMKKAVLIFYAKNKAKKKQSICEKVVNRLTKIPDVVDNRSTSY